MGLGVRLRLWCLTPQTEICQLYRDCQFYWWRKAEYPEETNDLSEVTGELYHIMLYHIEYTSLERNSSSQL
jgi:hypothetical protein